MAVNRNVKSGRGIYQFALFGDKGSGKTCFLVALTCSINDPAGNTVSWIEHDLDSANAGNSVASNAQEESDAGRWMHERKQLLESGEVPEATPIDSPREFTYEVTTPNQGAFRMELFDYSGELIEAHADTLAQRLRQHMKSRDGLVFLFEFPRPDQDRRAFESRLATLKEAFAHLRETIDDESTLQKPVALIVNKWDRHHNINWNDPAEESRALEELLASDSDLPHHDLIHTLRNTVGGDNFQIFPASAFGSAQLRADGREVPVVTDQRLKSFGLCAPFAWLVDRADSIEVDRLHKDAGHASCFNPFAAWTNWLRAGALDTRLPKLDNAGHPSNLRDTVGKVRARSSWILFGWLLGVVLVLFGCHNWYHWSVLEPALATLRLPNSGDAETTQARGTVRGYIDSASWWFAFFRTRNSLEDALAKHLERVELAVWGQVEQASDAEKARLAADYLKSFANGPHAAEANSILVQRETQRSEDAYDNAIAAAMPARRELLRSYLLDFPEGSHRDAAQQALILLEKEEERKLNEDYLEERKAELARILDLPDTSREQTEAKLNSLQRFKDALELPQPASGSSEQRELSLCKSQILAAMSKLSLEKAMAAWRSEYEKAWVAIDLPRAALLLENAPENGDTQVERERFHAEAAQRFEKWVLNKVQVNAFEEAEREIGRCRQDPVILKILGDSFNDNIARASKYVLNGNDEHAYGLVRKYAPNCREEISRYLSAADSPKTMKDEVERYLKWLDYCESPQDLELVVLAVRLHENQTTSLFGTLNHSVKLEVDEGKPETGVFDHNGPYEHKAGPAVKMRKIPLTDKVKIRLLLEGRTGWLSSAEGNDAAVVYGHEYVGTLSVKELGAAKTVKLKSLKRKEHDNEAKIQALGLRAAPELPAYRQATIDGGRQ